MVGQGGVLKNPFYAKPRCLSLHPAENRCRMEHLGVFISIGRIGAPEGAE